MKFSAAQLAKNRMFVFRNYFIYNSPDDMKEALEKSLHVELTDRTLRSYFRWAENKMKKDGILERDSEMLKNSIMTQLERLRRLGEQAARDEARARAMNVYTYVTDEEGKNVVQMVHDPKTGQNRPVLDPEAIMRQDNLIRSATYRQLNVEKQILLVFTKTGAVVPHEEIEVGISQELTVLLVKANISIAYQYIPADKRQQYIEAAASLEEARVEDLELIVRGTQQRDDNG